MGNLGVVPFVLAFRFRFVPFRALRILRAIRVFPVRDAMITSSKNF